MPSAPVTNKEFVYLTLDLVRTAPSSIKVAVFMSGPSARYVDMVKTCTGHFRFSDHIFSYRLQVQELLDFVTTPGHGPTSHKIQYITETDTDALPAEYDIRNW